MNELKKTLNVVETGWEHIYMALVVTMKMWGGGA